MSFSIAGPAFASHPSEMSQFVPFAELLVRKDKTPKAAPAPAAATPSRKAAPNSSSRSSSCTSAQAPAYSAFPPRTSSLASPPPPYRAHNVTPAEFEHQLARRTDDRVAAEVKAFGF